MNLKPEAFYEIELKAILTEEKYNELKKHLNSNDKFKLINTESIHTDFWKDKDRNDLRLRHSDKTIEFVFKKGLITKICRQEIKIPLLSMDYLMHWELVLDSMMTNNRERGTMKHKQEFIYEFKGYKYVICLQFIEKLARLLEVEFLAEREEESVIHEPNLRMILAELGLTLIDGDKYMARVMDYVAGKDTLNYPI
jgi:adenylate cyclase class IV